MAAIQTLRAYISETVVDWWRVFDRLTKCHRGSRGYLMVVTKIQDGGFEMAAIFQSGPRGVIFASRSFWGPQFHF